MDREQVGAAWRHLVKTLNAGAGFQQAQAALASLGGNISDAVQKGAYTLWRIASRVTESIRGYFQRHGTGYDDFGALDGSDPVTSRPIRDEAPFPETLPGGVIFPNGRTSVEWTYTIEIEKPGGGIEYTTGRTKLHLSDDTDAAIADILEHIASLREKYKDKSFTLLENTIREVS